MVHGILDLVQKSQYNAFLNEEPEITFFRMIYPRHTPFSREFRTDVMDGGTEWGSELVYDFPKVGDLLHRCYVVFDVSVSLQKALIKHLAVHENADTVETFMRDALPLTGEQLVAVRQLMDGLASGFDSDGVLTSPFAETLEEASGQYDIASITLAYLCIDYYNHVVEPATNDLGNTKLMRFLKDTVSGTAFADHPLLAHFLLDKISVEIAGQTVSSYSGDCLNAFTQLRNEVTSEWYKRMVRFQFDGGLNQNSAQAALSCTVVVPVHFWFNENSTLVLPTVALRYADVRLTLNLAKQSPLDYDVLQIDGIRLCTENIFLTAQERFRFTSSTLEYIVEDFQEELHYCTFEQLETTIELDFVRPVKYLVWWVTLSTPEKGRIYDPEYLLPNKEPPFKSCSVVLNHSMVGTESSSEYYRLVQPWQAFGNSPTNGIHVYSFALFPQSPNPSGTCNLSMVTSKYLRLGWNPAVLSLDPGTRATVHVAAVGYNVMRISNGFCQLLE